MKNQQSIVGNSSGQRIHFPKQINYNKLRDGWVAALQAPTPAKKKKKVSITSQESDCHILMLPFNANIFHLFI